MKIPFTKMHGLGNDFVVLDLFGQGKPLAGMDEARARVLCDRRFGVGADQVLVVGPPHGGESGGAASRMEIWNADGSTAEMCGNGIRAVALYLHDHAPEALRGRGSYRIETGAGVLEVFIEGRLVRVDMGPPRLLADRAERLETPHGAFEFWEVSMGNPHAVIFVPPGSSLGALELEKIGPAIENHPRFPKRTNVEFVRVAGPGEVDVRVWERGAGITLACGTGACASAVATLHSLARDRGGSLKVRLPAGSLRLDWNGKKTGPVWMTGPAVEVFRGEFSDPSGSADSHRA
jgi:diaminopimelate epimerase